MIKRLNKACNFFPCHAGLEDCTFCYCPLYPCLNKKKGRFIYSIKNKNDIWSCKSCGWIHKRKVVDYIFTMIQINKYRKQNLKKNNKTGTIILSHGSKLKKANVSLDKTVRMVKQKTGIDAILPAYLQFYQPDLERSVKNFIARGYKTIIIIPFFLFNGNHVARDIPRIIEKEKEKYPHINFIYTRTLGEDAKIADIISGMVEETMAQC